MKTTLHYLSLIGKALGLASAFNVIPGVSQEKSVLIFFIASTLKDAVNRVTEYLQTQVDAQEAKQP